MKFAHEVVSNEGRKNGTECAISAGYAQDSAGVRAAELQNPRRFQIRISDGGDVEFSANPIDEGFNGFTCPEQTGKVPTCADCGLCWTTNKNVNFITH